MDIKLEEVTKQLKEGNWRFQWVKPKDKPKYTSTAYEVIQLLYDDNSKIVLHYYLCDKCKKIIISNLSAEGNYKLRRHKCYKEYMEKKNRESAEVEKENSKIDGGDDDDDQEKIDAKNLFLSDIIDVDEYDFGRNENENEESDNDQHVEYGAASLATYMHKFGKMVNEMGEFPVHVIRQHIPESFDASEW